MIVPRKFHAIESIDPCFYNNENDPFTDPEFASFNKKYKLMIFGGCYGDYDLLSDLYEIDLTEIINSDQYNSREEIKEMNIDEDTGIKRDTSMEKEDEQGISITFSTYYNPIHYLGFKNANSLFRVTTQREMNNGTIVWHKENFSVNQV